MTEDARFYMIALSLVPNIGPVLAKQLIAYSGSAEAVFKQSKRALSRIPGIGERRASEILNAKVRRKAGKEMEFIGSNDIQVYSYLDSDYPGRLKVFQDMPVVLYYKGQADLNGDKHVGIVGTRRPTPYGKAEVSRFVQSIKGHQPLIVSGLAYGIDIAAHRTALEEGLPTVGVMATGLDMVYPAAHRGTAEKMVSSGGLLTEFPSGLYLDPERFPMRNRILAALSDALVVIESRERGGSMITADMAFGYNKDVFALPGRSTDECSKGPNALIKEQKANLMENGEDMIRMMMWDQRIDKMHAQRLIFNELKDEERVIWDIFRAQPEVHIDLIQLKTGFSPSKLAELLLNLEFRGLIRSLPGKRYYLIQ